MPDRRFRHVRAQGTWYRIVLRGRDPLDFSRTRSAGGRYHAPRSSPTLYLGDQPATCLLEVLVHAFELPSTYDLVAVDVTLRRVVDLVTDDGRKAAGVSLKSLVAQPRPVVNREGAIVGTRYGVTWRLGRAAWESGASGLLVPSAALPAQRILIAFRRSSTVLDVRQRHPIPIDPRMRRFVQNEAGG